MKTVIFNGSPREEGDTAALLETFRPGLGGEFREFNAYRSGVSACTDCRWCFSHGNCRFQDGMDDILQAAEEADILLIASPLYYSTLTGPLLSLFSRFQVLYAARFAGRHTAPSGKLGAALFAAGGDSKDLSPAVRVSRIILRQLGAEFLGYAGAFDTNHLPAREDAAALQTVKELADAVRARYESEMTR